MAFKKFCLSLLCVVFFATHVTANDEVVDNESTVSSEISKNNQLILNNLSAISTSLSKAREELSLRQEQLGSNAGRGRESEITEQIKALAREVQLLELNFNEIAAQYNPRQFLTNDNKESINWLTEAQEILKPLLDEIKRLSSKPRENSRLRTQIADLKDNQGVTNAALTNINKLLQVAKEQQLKEQLLITKKWWEQEKSKIEADLKIAENRLALNLQDKKGLFESAAQVPNLFIKGRAKNLTIALLVAISFWFILRRFYALLTLLSRRAEGEIKKQSHRLFAVLYILAAGVGTIAVFLIVLSYFEDWVLLTLSILVILGLLWTSKEAIPRFWEQLVLLLNVGTVKEGERIIYNGLPYKVKSLNLYTVLSNPLLIGGNLKIPIKDLATMRSRSAAESEQWFPTKVGDWVLHTGTNLGQVVMQTPERVIIELKGGALKVFKASEFINQEITNLSAGFRVTTVLRLEHQLINEATSVIPEQLTGHIQNGLVRHGYTNTLKSLVVEFSKATELSLDLDILASFSGEAAKDYEQIKRLLQKLSLEYSISAGWKIPLNQLKVQQAS